MKLDYDQITSQRHDSHDPESIQNEYLETLDMMYPQDKDYDPYKQEYYKQIQEKPKIKNGQKRELNF